MPQPPKRVLCVEDNQDIGLLLYTTLRAQGYDAVVTYTAGDAHALAGREDFDLFIIDTVPGEGSGVELCRQLRERYPATPVLFYSAAAFDRDREAALRAGACAYVAKPDMAGLGAAVRRALAAD